MLHFHISVSKKEMSPHNGDSPGFTKFIQTREESHVGQGHLRSASHLSACQAQPLPDLSLRQLPLGCYLGCWLKLLCLVHLSPSVLYQASCFLPNQMRPPSALLPPSSLSSAPHSALPFIQLPSPASSLSLSLFLFFSSAFSPRPSTDPSLKY